MRVCETQFVQISLVYIERQAPTEAWFFVQIDHVGASFNKSVPVSGLDIDLLEDAFHNIASLFIFSGEYFQLLFYVLQGLTPCLLNTSDAMLHDS